ncbi:MAG: undecaprenyl-diphosphate phosphatase [Actinomycetota bacterium]|nr:undecaprenyl-diphosphate phosphatase [Actinomycetota bacterium]
MPAIQAVVLGAVQGLTEFIPISSSGHLVLVPEALGWRRPGLAFDVLLHAASLIALLIYFWGDLIDLGRGAVAGDRPSRRLIALLLIGTVPAGIAGIVLGDFFEESFTDAPAAAIQLGITAVILVGAELALRYHERRVARSGGELRTMEQLNAADAGVIGVAQAISILPGISRSGATIGAGLGLSMTRDDSARFAFLLAIPSLFGATLVELPDLRGTALGAGAALGGFLSSLAFSYAAIWGLIRYLRRNTLYPFAAYCVVAAMFFYLIV